jgi:hypothetical protein
MGVCSRSLMCHLRPGENLEAELKNVLPPNELSALLASAHRPNYCVQVCPVPCLVCIKPMKCVLAI